MNRDKEWEFIESFELQYEEEKSLQATKIYNGELIIELNIDNE